MTKMTKKKLEINFEWNWNAQMLSIIKLLDMGTKDGKRYAREELMKLAEKLDRYNEKKYVEDE